MQNPLAGPPVPGQYHGHPQKTLSTVMLQDTHSAVESLANQRSVAAACLPQFSDVQSHTASLKASPTCSQS